ncbi:2-polyprenyl-6-methoxyphenol hydroxylase-like FAD-dependent oxidoreductase [Nocardia tenerifensis]|uniref:2-polyprenyl-6-methoxyphenol hydroxylase-like FAD-dependent oxidoreductase n=1 Tax=Nocardia tenerifensis TaxID=228006 RepID=A0A318JY93_9NOCA|nr:FAD-dependent monooxygenase [Nocardia tenerifensis]PXX62285.1 2-polyprenyl-6-methoxyphenol hydroxylase-like FAD-dependent oxidoreductase [Nocardia tenerifensis]
MDELVPNPWHTEDVIIVGAGIGGLVLALALHANGVPCRVFEAAPKIEPLGMGINIQPYATEILADLGLLDALESRAVVTREFVFYNRHGQEIYRSPAGRYGGQAFPQLSIHRADLHAVLLDAVQRRIGADHVRTGWRCLGVGQGGGRAWASFTRSAAGTAVYGSAVVGCDGIHSVVYRSLYPAGPPLRYSGTNMWRGTSVFPDFLSGASMVRAGLPAEGKLVVYPIRRDIDRRGNNLVNWVVEVDTPMADPTGATGTGRVADFAERFADWRFDWLDVPELLRCAHGPVLSMPMMDRDPLDRWSRGRITLLGDAAHPMVPLGSNGGGQAILDARSLATHLATAASVVQALRGYEEQRRPHTTNIVLGDRKGVVDLMVREVDRRTRGLPFRNLAEIISSDELAALSIPNYHEPVER